MMTLFFISNDVIKRQIVSSHVQIDDATNYHFKETLLVQLSTFAVSGLWVLRWGLYKFQPSCLGSLRGRHSPTRCVIDQI